MTDENHTHAERTRPFNVLTGEAERVRDRMIDEYGPVIGYQRAALGADRFARFVEGHGHVQAMSLFLVMSVMSAPNAEYSDGVLEAILDDAHDVKRAAEMWAHECELLVAEWRTHR
jgi:hypothetical protein